MRKTLLIILYLLAINVAKADITPQIPYPTATKIYTLNSADESSKLFVSCFKNYEKQNETCLDTEGNPLTGKIQTYNDKIDKIEEEITFEKGKVVETTKYQYTDWRGQQIPVTKHIYQYANDKKIMYELYQGDKLKIRVINQGNDLIAHYYFSNIHISLNLETIYTTKKKSTFDITFGVIRYIPKTDFSLIFIKPTSSETIYVSDGKYSLSTGTKLIASYQIKNKKLDGSFTVYTENGEKIMEVMYKRGKASSGYRYKNGNKNPMTPIHLYRINGNSLLLQILDDVPL